MLSIGNEHRNGGGNLLWHRLESMLEKTIPFFSLISLPRYIPPHNTLTWLWRQLPFPPSPGCLKSFYDSSCSNRSPEKLLLRLLATTPTTITTTTTIILVVIIHRLPFLLRTQDRLPNLKDGSVRRQRPPINSALEQGLQCWKTLQAKNKILRQQKLSKAGQAIMKEGG